jgi:hypothetical protein
MNRLRQAMVAMVPKTIRVPGKSMSHTRHCVRVMTVRIAKRERALKKAILHRKNSLFYKTRNGARVGDIYMSLIYTCELNDANATAAAEVAQALTHQIGEIFPSEELRYRLLPPTQSRQVIPEIISRMLFRFIVIEDFAPAICPQSFDEDFRCSGNDIRLLQKCVAP